jgi:hypothetical protein
LAANIYFQPALCSENPALDAPHKLHRTIDLSQDGYIIIPAEKGYEKTAKALRKTLKSSHNTRLTIDTDFYHTVCDNTRNILYHYHLININYYFPNILHKISHRIDMMDMINIL